MISGIYERIEERLEATGLKAAVASEMAGLSNSAIRNIKRARDAGRGGVTVGTLERLAPVLGVTPVWLIGGDRAPAVPLVSMVSASRLRDQPGVTAKDIQKTLDVGDLPSRGDWIALGVEGDSMDRVAPDGATILVNRADDTLVPGACYVFSVDDGAATFKRWMTEPARLQPYSTNPDHLSIFVDNMDIYVVGRVRRVLIDI